MHKLLKEVSYEKKNIKYGPLPVYDSSHGKRLFQGR